MECVCGYEYWKEWDDKRKTYVTHGDQPFTTETVVTEADYGMGGTEAGRLTLYICPECDTVQAG